VCSCQRDKGLGYHNHARSWGAELSDIADLRFFVGGERPNDLLEDEVWLDVPDDYMSLPLKTKAICRYMLECDYTKCDCDTTVHPHFFREFPYGEIDLAGNFWGDSFSAPCGPGYFLSRRAAEVVVNFDHGDLWAEDYMVGLAVDQRTGFVRKPFDTQIYSAFSGHRGAAHEPYPARILIWMRRPGRLDPNGCTLPRC
jgi:hypothetical protein